MAIFGTKKNTKTEKKALPAQAGAPVKAVKAVVAKKATVAVASTVGAEAILRPRITEKSGILSQGGVYTFEIAKNANKNSVAHAITALYKVVPTKIAVINVPAKRVFIRGRHGSVAGIRKAVVTLKKGDKIDFV